MLTIYEINKNSKKKVLLIHGLFSSSGFWLPYLYNLKKFHLLILNIDYEQILNCSQKKINMLFQEISEIHDIEVIVAHSFGTVISHHIQIDIPRINICPIHNAEKINLKEFIRLISKQTRINFDQVYSTIDLMDNFLLNTEYQAGKKNIVNFYPNNDKFFNYSVKKSKDNILFTGDHFDISDAIYKMMNLKTFRF